MPRSLSKWFACWLCGWCLFAAAPVQAQQENDVFQQDPGLFGGNPPLEEAEAAEPAAPAAPQTGGFQMPGMFGAPQFTQEQQEAREKQINELYETAQGLQQQGDLDGAIQKYQEILAISARHAPSYFEIGRMRREQKFYDQAIQAQQLAIKFSPNSFQPYLELGKVYQEQRSYRNAIDELQSAAKRRFGDPEVYYQLGLAQAQFGYGQILGDARQENILEAIASFDLALRFREDYPEALFERGSARLQLGLLDDAIEDLRAAVALDPQNPQPTVQLGFASLQRAGTEANARAGQTARIVADFQQAIQALDAYFALVPSDQEALRQEQDGESEIRRESVYLVRAAARSGWADELSASEDRRRLYDGVIQDTDAILAFNPDSASAYYQKGLAQRMLGDLDAALDSLTKALAISPGDAETLLRRGIVYFRRGQFELALADFLQATRDPRVRYNPRARFWAGLANARLGNHKQAITEYSVALRYQPLFPLAYLNRGIAYLKVGRPQRAVFDFDEVLRGEKDNPVALRLVQVARQLADDSSS